MAAIPRKVALDEITDFLASGPKPEEILAFRLSETTQRHAHDLLERSQQRELTADEQREIEDYSFPARENLSFKGGMKAHVSLDFSLKHAIILLSV